jgi:hypothetical protein
MKVKKICFGKTFSAPMMWVKENFQFFHFSSTRS